MTEKKRIAIFGAGGHGKVVFDAIQACGCLQVAYIFDDNPSPHKDMFGCRIEGNRNALREHAGGIDAVVVAIGDNKARVEVADWIVRQGLALATITHPAATVSPSARIDDGSMILAGAVVNADARIGKNTIINSMAVVEHDCLVGDGVHIAPGAILCGGVQIGDFSLVGAGSVILPGVIIQPGRLVKAGSLAKSHQ